MQTGNSKGTHQSVFNRFHKPVKVTGEAGDSPQVQGQSRQFSETLTNTREVGWGRSSMGECSPRLGKQLGSTPALPQIRKFVSHAQFIAFSSRQSNWVLKAPLM